MKVENRRNRLPPFNSRRSISRPRARSENKINAAKTKKRWKILKKSHGRSNGNYVTAHKREKAKQPFLRAVKLPLEGELSRNPCGARKKPRMTTIITTMILQYSIIPIII